MQRIRNADLLKKPGVSETLDWARALMSMNKACLDEDVVRETLGCFLKYQEDIGRFNFLQPFSEHCFGKIFTLGIDFDSVPVVRILCYAP